MSGSGVVYKQSQITTMESAIDQAESDLASQNYSAVISDLTTYYSTQIYTPGTQTVMRGYAQLALDVLSNSGLGVVANKDVENAVGQANYTSAFKATLAYDLAKQDFSNITAHGNQVPTLAQVATDHQLVFSNSFGNLPVQIPITAWGGTPFVALGQDFTDGKATPAELSDIQPSFFDNLSGFQVDLSIGNLERAGVESLGSLNWQTDLNGFGTVLKLQNELFGKFPNLGPLPFSIQENNNGSYQIADLQTDTATDGTYSNFSSSGQQNYSIDVNAQSGTLAGATVSVVVGTVQGPTFDLNGSTSPEVLIDTNASAVSAGSAGSAVLIDNGGGTLTGGSGQNLLLELGNDGTVDGGSGPLQVVLSGYDETVNASGSTITLEDSTQATLTGNSDTIVGGNADTLTVDGTGNTATLGTGAVVTVNGDNNSLTLGNGGTITLLGTNTIFVAGDDGSLDLGTSGDTAIITGLGMVISANGDTVGTENNTNVTVNGSGNTIDFWDGNAAVTASGDTVQVGSANATEASLTGSNNTFTTWSPGTLFVSGASDNMYMDSSGVELVLTGPSMNVTPYTAGDYLYIEASTTATIDGSSETIQFAGEFSYINAARRFWSRRWWRTAMSASCMPGRRRRSRWRRFRSPATGCSPVMSSMSAGVPWRPAGGAAAIAFSATRTPRGANPAPGRGIPRRPMSPISRSIARRSWSMATPSRSPPAWPSPPRSKPAAAASSTTSSRRSASVSMTG